MCVDKVPKCDKKGVTFLKAGFILWSWHWFANDLDPGIHVTISKCEKSASTLQNGRIIVK
eukprot:TRINITY_DN10494_c0_g1_i1.p1 TRINITY_DN10494_c0_g1~~TRINITY_DN10494_c0_g1_i1.p1  ORF type:complete len:60 (+),score=9.64 TRINITY_DN10494_c0_g1_i1:243-422(+)